jgi:hypothetical protein
MSKHGIRFFVMAELFLAGFAAARAMGAGTEECEPSSGSDFGASGPVELHDEL